MPHRKNRTMNVKATDAQALLAKLIGEKGMSNEDAGAIAYPNAKNPGRAARESRKAPAVKVLLMKHQIKAIRMDASAISYETLRKAAKGGLEGLPAKWADRIKAAIALHDKFGFGSVKTDDGDPFNLEELAETELDDFIIHAEKQLQGESPELEDSEHETVDGECELVDDETENKSVDELFPKKPIDSEEQGS